MKRAGVAGLTVVALALQGCASGKLGEAVDLSTAGAAASAKLLRAATDVGTAYAASEKSDRFLRALQAAGQPTGKDCAIDPNAPATPVPSDANPQSADNIAKTEAALRARVQLAAALGKTYSAMNALASYDAAGAVEAGIADAFDATNAFRGAVGLPGLPPAAGLVVAKIGGGLIQKRQVGKLKQASVQLRTALEGYKQALEAGRVPTTSVLRFGIGETYNLRIALWRRQYLDANDYLSQLGSGSGLTAPPPGIRPFTAANPALCVAVRAALEAERDDLRAAVNDEYAAQIAVVDSLIAAHADFEHDAPVDAAHLAALLDQMTALASKIGSAK